MANPTRPTAKSSFQPASRKNVRGRVGIMGPSGSGKTWTSLAIAKGIAEVGDTKVALIDSENGSAGLYADQFNFAHAVLPATDVDSYIRLIREAGREHYSPLIVDSISHEWAGPGGILEMVDKFTNWKDATPRHNEFMIALLSYPGDLIVTMRQKTDWVVEKNSAGKMVPRRVGLAPVQRPNTEYEFDIMLSLDREHNMSVVKTRWKEIEGQTFELPGVEFGKDLKQWLKGGV